MTTKKTIAGELEMTRRRWFGALAGLAAVVAAVRREPARPEAAAEKKRRRRFWIGHT